MATFDETRELNSKTFIAQQCMNVLNLSKAVKFCWSQFSVFALKDSLKNDKFSGVLLLQESSLVTYSEMSALASRKDIPEQGMNFQVLS